MSRYKIAFCNTPDPLALVKSNLQIQLQEAIPELIVIEPPSASSDWSQYAREYLIRHHPDVRLIVQEAGRMELIDSNRYTIALLYDNLRGWGRPSDHQERILQQARKRITQSWHMTNYYPEYRFEVIPIGIDPDLFTPMLKTVIRKKLGFEAETIGIFVGRFSEAKGWSAIQACIRHYPNVLWILVSSEAEFFNAPNVRVFNRIPQKLLAQLLNCADFFITACQAESQGLAPLEACFCDVPVIMNTIGSFSALTPVERAQVGLFDMDFISAIAQIKNHQFRPRELMMQKKFTIAHTMPRWRMLFAKAFIEMERGY